MSELFNAQEYWADKISKKWVVVLATFTRNKVSKTETRYICSKTSAGAGRAAKAETFMKKAKVVSIRLATPIDLGCTLDTRL